MRNVGHFEKVSYDRFIEDVELYNPELFDDSIDYKYLYDNMKIPDRATKGSAGYDFYLPFSSVIIKPRSIITIPTGIRVNIIDEWYLKLCPKSGLSFEYPLRLIDTVSIIDGDYYHCNNEGHIIVKIANENKHKTCFLNFNDKYIQGIFTEYGITDDDCCKGIRTGGFGSTSENKFKRFPG